MFCFFHFLFCYCLGILNLILCFNFIFCFFGL
jgi:hypothetical protein